ncbi:ATP-binding protein [Vibrio sp. B1FLJ16]|uniref:ATP-binding protein n=1 Tax=Vibrio sp. B1FLJ16 TaxID=2751178 RepID=UPI0015F49305|nr:ATP-binding protein [Vibrio sp. B1FLJ16]CAD7812964.1 DNA mismatch repair [Vibrio sp. B1FLJ16]CAE6920200.1 DNA mismatch repair [Vibrio sp. B1FLJ16]
MTEKKLSASNSGVRNKFNRVSKAKAFAEYVWNSLDSGATDVEINVRADQELNQILDITITDNGSGIEMKGDISPFDKFEESSKKNANDPLIKGKYGRGRLSFFKFCRSASWVSKHKNNDRYVEIKITDGSLDRFIINQSDNNESLLSSTGTRVTFNELSLTIDEFNKSFVNYLENHVTWICKVKKNIKLRVNGHELSQAEIINESYFDRDILSDNVQFDVIAWKNSIENESPHIYFCDLNNNVITKKRYKSKNSFNCSCVISSNWFSQFNSDDETVLTSKVDIDSEKFQTILKCATDSLDEKYLELKKSAIDELIDEYEREGIISTSHAKSPLSRFKTQQLKDAIRVIFQADSSVFTELSNKKQKTILVKLIDRIVNSDDPDSLFEVLDGVISLSDSDMKILSNTLEKVTMTNIVRTIKQLEDRLHALDLFEKLLENKNDTYEVAHIQKVVESNMWIFGEEFNVLTTEEEKFDKALRKYLKFKNESIDSIDDIENEDYHPRHYDKYSIEHQHKQKEMDIFASQKMPMYDQGEAYFKNIIVELKRPSVKLTDKELQQIKNYMSVVSSEDNFDTTKDQWDFVLVGNQISTNPQKSFNINMELKNSKVYGKPGLAGDYGNMRIWVKEWSQVIGDYKLRYNHIIKSLNKKYDEVLEDNPNKLTQNIKSLSNV